MSYNLQDLKNESYVYIYFMTFKLIQIKGKHIFNDENVCNIM